MRMKHLKWLALILLFMPVFAHAQDMEAECATPQSEIADLKEPEFGAPNVWDVLYAKDGMDVFTDFVPVDEKTFVAAGSFTKDKEDNIYHPLLVKFDERLKPLWEIREETKDQKTIHRVLQKKEGFAVLGDITDSRGNGIYIASYDDDGKQAKKSAPVYEPGGDLDARAFIPAQDGGGYIVAAQFVKEGDQNQQHGILYKLSSSGSVVWKRTFLTGRSNVFNNVQATLNGDYIITGQIVTEGGKSGGWMVRVNTGGAIQWQQTYPRGSAASLQIAGQTKEGEYIVSGKARPFGTDNKGLSAWVMKTDDSGKMIWQRFFNGDYDYGAPGLIVYEDGRASVLLSAGAMDSGRRSHARLLTLSSTGNIQHLEDFTDGQNAAAHRLVSGFAGERVIIGHAQTAFGEKQESNEARAAPVYTYDGWLVAAQPLDLYEDPCAPPPAMSPILP